MNSISSGFHIPAMPQPTLPNFLVVSDVNNTVTFYESAKGKKNNPFISQITEKITEIWAENLPKMTYKEYIQKVVIPGNKDDKVIKEKQEQKIGNFFADLDRSKHPEIYEKAIQIYQDLEKQYWDKETDSVKFDLFPSFFHLIDTLKTYGQCSVTFQTLGFDGDRLAEELQKLGWKAPQRATMVTGGGLQFAGENEIITGPELLRRLQMGTTIVQVSFKDWKAHNTEAAFGKIVPCVADGMFDGRPFFTLFIDDNLRKPAKTNTDSENADPKEKNIAYPRDIYGRPANWNSKGIMGLTINTVKAALNIKYITNKMYKHFAKREVALFNLAKL